MNENVFIVSEMITKLFIITKINSNPFVLDTIELIDFSTFKIAPWGAVSQTLMLHSSKIVADWSGIEINILLKFQSWIDFQKGYQNFL